MRQQTKTRYRIYYMKPECFETYIHGTKVPTRHQLEETHVQLRDIEVTSLGAIYGLMQGEVWSPKGEARSLIMDKGLGHTSMSVGDVVEEIGTGEMWACARLGWTKMP